MIHHFNSSSNSKFEFVVKGTRVETMKQWVMKPNKKPFIVTTQNNVFWDKKLYKYDRWRKECHLSWFFANHFLLNLGNGEPFLKMLWGKLHGLESLETRNHFKTDNFLPQNVSKTTRGSTIHDVMLSNGEEFLKKAEVIGISLFVVVVALLMCFSPLFDKVFITINIINFYLFFFVINFFKNQ